jgi:hypothetical protein
VKKENVEDTKGVIRSRKSNKDRENENSDWQEIRSSINGQMMKLIYVSGNCLSMGYI